MAEIMKDTHRFIHFNLAHTGAGEDNHYVDLAKCMSAINQRGYRQGMVYHVANIVFDDADGDADIDVCILPNTWRMQAAWQLGFNAWHEQQKAAMDSIDQELGRYSDFKIYMTNDAIDDADNAVPIDVNGNTFPFGDWDYSKLILPDDGGAEPNDCFFLGLGDWYGTYPDIEKTSLLKQLHLAMMKVQEDPDFAANDAERCIYALSDGNQPGAEVLHDVLDDIMEDNVLPPYSADTTMGGGSAGAGQPASPWVARTVMIKGGSSTSSATAAVGGFAAPCGLLMIETNASGDNSIGCTIELVPGEYKGVHAYPMRGGGF